MNVLGIESTCDETACAVVEDGKKILSNVIYSQENMHAKFGGVVPELASRKHCEVISTVVEESLGVASLTLDDIDLISVANGPGLLGSLLVGVNFAKGLSLSLNKPFIGVNHVEAHLIAPLMHHEAEMPAIGVVISGGHTALLYIPKMGEYQLIGETQDDAIGEAFDKVASLLGLPYPGGPKVEILARNGDPKKYLLSPGKVKGRPFDFSFSGLKTAVLYTLKGQNGSKETQILEEEKKDLAASFQETALNDILEKTLMAAQKFHCKSIIFGGGVSSNMRLRALFDQNQEIKCYWPEKKLALDNGAMIASLGFFEYKRRQKGDNYALEPYSRFHWNLSCRL